MRYLCLVSVLPTYDDRQLSPCGEAACSTDREAEHCTVVNATGSKMYFSYLKECSPKNIYLFNVYTMF